MPNYGIFQEKDLDLNALAATVDRDRLLEAQMETMASHNENVNRLLRIFSDPVDSPQLAVDAGTTNRLQPLDENGRPQPVKGISQYIVGFPLYKAGTAQGWNFWTHEQMTVEDFARSLDLMLKGDVTWVRDEMLSAFFYNGAGYTYTNTNPAASLTVYGLANNDTVTYDATGGAAADNHYAFQAAAIDTANNPFPAMYTDLIEHPVNAGRIVAFVPPGLVAAISLLADFSPAPNNVPIIRVAPASSASQPEPAIAPGLDLPLTSTMTYIGVTGNVHIVQWQNLPANFIIGVAVDADVAPLGFRQYAQPALRGFVNIGEPMARFPYQQDNFVRAAGFGGLNRVGAYVIKMGAGSYAAPTGYTAPLA